MEEHKRFNQWFINYNNIANQPPINLLDTTNIPLEETARDVTLWIQTNQS
jgi:hypothetical protein